MSSCHGTHIYIENWSTFPVHVSQVTVPSLSGEKTLKTNFSVQPGQSVPLKIEENNTLINNFNKIIASFNNNGYIKEETIFFPDEETEETSLSFGDSGYKRWPYKNFAKK